MSNLISFTYILNKIKSKSFLYWVSIKLYEFWGEVKYFVVKGILWMNPKILGYLAAKEKEEQDKYCMRVLIQECMTAFCV